MPRMKPLPEGTPTEPVWYLRGLPYSEYRQSNWWRIRRDRYTATVVAVYGRKTCEICELAAFETVPLEVRFHVHHLAYDHLGDEPDDDLILLCPPCHNVVHYPDSQAAQHWLEIERGHQEWEQRAVRATPKEAA